MGREQDSLYVLESIHVQISSQRFMLDRRTGHFCFIFDTLACLFCGYNCLIEWLHRYPHDQLPNGWFMFQLTNHHNWYVILCFHDLPTHRNNLVNLAVSHCPQNPEFQTSLSTYTVEPFQTQGRVCGLFKSLQRCLFVICCSFHMASCFSVLLGLAEMA